MITKRLARRHQPAIITLKISGLSQTAAEPTFAQGIVTEGRDRVDGRG